MTVDNHVGSPFQDRVYVSWTTFDVDGTAYIWEAWSNDYAEHFSSPVLVSSDSALCGQTYGLATPSGRCNENQFSQPFTGTDGSLYVAFANFNNVVSGDDNRNQMLLVKSTDGGRSFGAPVKIGDYYDLPTATRTRGRARIPAGHACRRRVRRRNSVFRATNYPSGAVNPNDPSQVVVTYGSYINSTSNETNGCVPAGFGDDRHQRIRRGEDTGSVQQQDPDERVSERRGELHGRTGQPTRGPRRRSTSRPGGQLAVLAVGGVQQRRQARGVLLRPPVRHQRDDWIARTSRLSGSKDLATFGTKRVTSSSMPPPTQFSGQFFGDYTGLDAVDDAHPLWMDTRDPDLFLCPGTGTPGHAPEVCTGTESGGYQTGMTANDEDVFTAGVAIPTK